MTVDRVLYGLTVLNIVILLLNLAYTIIGAWLPGS
jgi:hypothetical protein